MTIEILMMGTIVRTGGFVDECSIRCTEKKKEAKVQIFFWNDLIVVEIYLHFIGPMENISSRVGSSWNNCCECLR